MNLRILYKLFKICCAVAIAIFVLSCTPKTTESSASASVSYLELNLNDTASASPFTFQSSSLELFRIIEKISKDANINGIILNIGSISRSRDQLWEIRSALENLKTADKKIIAYINNANIDVYMLASIADKIVMDELGLLTMLGYSAGQGYFSQTLEKLGVGVMELRYFEYKSAAEPFTRTSMSDADRLQLSDYLDDSFNLTRQTLIEARSWSTDEFEKIINEQFMLSAISALNFNLIDFIGKDAVKEAIAELEEDVQTEKKSIKYYLYGNADSSLILALNEGGKPLPYSAARAGRASGTIAIVYADGQTDMNRGMEAAKLSKIIRELADNTRVKAIVVRMNSPGGDAYAADVFAEAVRYAKQKKPVVVSMEQVAASGGYWASLTASHIMATPYTITGSIGVIGSWFYDNGLYEKLGLTTDILKRGEHSDLFTGFLIPYRKLTEQEEEQYKQFILDLYDVFIDKVADGRDMSKAAVEAAAQGRIYSGIGALESGLIDSVGSFSDALMVARKLAGISEDAIIAHREYPEPTFFERMMHNLSSVNTNPPALLDTLMLDADFRYRLENNGKIMPILPHTNIHE